MGKPISKEGFISRHSAYFQNLGFDVQFAGFIRYAMTLSLSDVIRYEEEDDFVIERSQNGVVITEYYQVKHSIDSKMTNADSDFWKTIDNWISLYTLSTREEKKVFFTKGRFYILTNKIVDNDFYSKIEALKEGTIQISDIKDYIASLEEKGTSYQSTLSKLALLDTTILNQFLHKVEIIRFDNFYGAIYEQFLQTYFRPTQADTIVKELIGEIWEAKLNSKKLEYSGESFNHTYKGTLEKICIGEKLTLDLEEVPMIEAEHVQNAQNMVEQLKAIQVVDNDSDEKDFILSNYLELYYKLKNALVRFYKTSLMTSKREQDIDDKAQRTWKGIFIREQRTLIQADKRGEPIPSEAKATAGQKTLNNVMEEHIESLGQVHEKEFSNAWFLKLSNDNPIKVAWHFDWFKKYIK